MRRSLVALLASALTLVAFAASAAATPLRFVGTAAYDVEVDAHRYVLTTPTGRAPVVKDDLTGATFHPSVEGCRAAGLRFPELLVGCPDQSGRFGPVLVNLRTGSRITFPPAVTDPPPDPSYHLGPVAYGRSGATGSSAKRPTERNTTTSLRSSVST